MGNIIQFVKTYWIVRNPQRTTLQPGLGSPIVVPVVANVTLGEVNSYLERKHLPFWSLFAFLLRIKPLLPCHHTVHYDVPLCHGPSGA